MVTSLLLMDTGHTDVHSQPMGFYGPCHAGGWAARMSKLRLENQGGP